ncbi:helix-turn-helix domain-containing protein [Mesorhizobium sp. M0898]|uniref:helix-turn-helix domain-containing protein n=1 Tax=Mesorhizobium sp. M0898 TaxID=2957020 RepID=UPI0033381F2C
MIDMDDENSTLFNHLAVAKKPWRWRALLRRADLPASAYKVGLALVDKFLNNSDGRCFPSASTLADECSILVRTVYDGIAALKEVGLLKTERRFDGSLDFIFLLPPITEKRERQSRKSGSGSHGNPGINLDNELPKLTIQDRSAGSGAPSADLRSSLASLGTLASSSDTFNHDDDFEESKRGCA